LTGSLFKIDDPNFAVSAFCFIASDDSSADANKLHKLIELCCRKCVPHNLFFTRSASNEIRVFLFPRMKDNLGVDKLYTSFLNVAFCELSGYIPIGDEELFATINESYILDRFRQETGNACEVVENEFVALLKEL